MRIPVSELNARRAEERVEALTKRKAKARRAPVSRLVEQVQEMMQSGDWSRARPAHMVELYAWCHEQVYRVRPAELEDGGAANKRTQLAADSCAARMLAQEFGGDAGEMVRYLRWVWTREARAEQWAKANKIERHKRLGWAFVFSARALLTDYRTAALRARQRATP